MTWTNRYHPPEASLWQGRTDAPPDSCFFQIIRMHDMRDVSAPTSTMQQFALIGFCSDEGVKRNLGRTGANEGPRAIREVLGKLPLQKKDFLIYDAGDISCEDGDLESAQLALAECIAMLLKSDITPIVLGGGHEVAFGSYQGIVKQFPKERLGIVNFDAHFDMRPLADNKGTSGTPFLQIAKAESLHKKKFDYNCIGIQQASNTHALFETAKAYDAKIILADDLHLGYTEKCVNFVDRIIDENQIIYLTLCLDVLAAPFAPGVSAPQVLGLSPWQVVPYLRQLAGSGKVVSYDIAELSPRFDMDNRTAKSAANFVFEIIHHHIHYLGNKHVNFQHPR